MRRGWRAGALVVALAAAIVATTATPAAAHAGLVEASDYEARITKGPGLPGVELRVTAGSFFELTNRAPTEVVVEGYEGEPYLRVGPGGAFENRRSPSVYLNATRNGGEALPAEANSKAAPRWRRIGDGPTVRWHDHRLHWMHPEPPPAVRGDEDRRHVVDRWRLGLRLGGSPAEARGVLTYVPAPSPWPWAALAVAIGIVVVIGRRRRLLLPAVVLLVAADVTRVVAVASATPGSGLRSAVDVGAVDAVGWGLAVAAGVLAARGRRRDGEAAAGVAAVLLAMVGGLFEWGDLGRSQLVVSGPPNLTRACVAATFGLGAGIAAAVLRSGRERSHERGEEALGQDVDPTGDLTEGQEALRPLDVVERE
jgi:hypothetical protein